MAENIEKRRRTRQKMSDALAELCGEKSYSEITVNDICERAQVYRSTFYRYYDTKDALLRQTEQEYLEKTRSLTPSLKDFRADASEEEMQVFLKELTADMEYHRRNAKLCTFLLSPAGDLWFHQKMIESIGATVRRNIASRDKKHTERKTQYMVTYFASGFAATIHEWLVRDDCSCEEIASFLLEMITQAVNEKSPG